MTDELPAHVALNRAHWDTMADQWVAMGEKAWADDEPSWGMWGIAERELGLLPADMTGLDAIELGCGTAYVSAWMARRGARVVGSTTPDANSTPPAGWRPSTASSWS